MELNSNVVETVRELTFSEIASVSGGCADFSDVQSAVSSTENFCWRKMCFTHAN